jgi:hypothetical protein
MSAVLLDRPDALYMSGKTYDGYGSVANTRAYMHDLLEKCVPDFAIPRDDRELVFEGWEALCTAYARPVFFEKSPQILAQWAALSLIAEWMERTRFTVRIVGLVRNPHSVLYSAARLFGTEPETRQIAWLNGCRNLLSFSQMVPEGSYMQLRYEDLVADPVNVFAQVTRFAGVEPDAGVGGGAHSNSSDKWIRDPNYRLSLDPAVWQMARHLGYAPTELENRSKAAGKTSAGRASSVVRKSRSLWINRLRDRFVQPVLIRLRAALRGQR